MSARLDKSLDEIISTQRRTSGRGRPGLRHRKSPGGAPAVAAPVGGIKKNARQAKGTVKAIPTGPSGGGEGKVIVSGLPKDVSEQMIKEYFGQSVGPIKRVEISYGPSGNSRGIANITFVRSESAAKAVASTNGMAIDGRPIKVELILDAARAKAIPAPKGLSERITQQPKPQPKSAATTKATGTAARGGRKAGRGRGGKNGRPAKKTAEELDSEMVDYWQAGATATEGEAAATGTAQPAAAPANGDANMDDEIL